MLATAPLELQRHIINTLAGHEKVERLGWLCGGYLIAALAIGGLKYTLNIKSAGLGEFTIRSLRKEVLRSATPPAKPDETSDQTGKSKPGALVTTISSQAEAVGKFVGDCISTPIVQAGTLLSVLIRPDREHLGEEAVKSRDLFADRAPRLGHLPQPS